VRTTINFGITLPKEVFEKTEQLRGYYSRSKYILMALECLAETIAKRSVQPVQVCAHDQADGRVSTQTPMEPMIDHE
jgi:hypothetical protein